VGPSGWFEANPIIRDFGGDDVFAEVKRDGDIRRSAVLFGVPQCFLRDSKECEFERRVAAPLSALHLQAEVLVRTDVALGDHRLDRRDQPQVIQR